MFLILFSFNLNWVQARIFVDVLHEKSQGLKRIQKTADAVKEIDQLRQSLSLKPLDRIATDDEQTKIIHTIVTTETASMLVDGAYDFQFSTKYLPLGGILNQREQIHYGWIFCLARTAQLLAENHKFDGNDIRLLLKRDSNSRHMPKWMKGVFNQNLESIDWISYVKPHLDVERFALVETRRTERAADVRGRPVFRIQITEPDLENASSSHDLKGIPFSKSAFLKPGIYTFHAYAIKPDGACMFYGSQGPYGYFGRKDFGEQILDNTDDDELLKDCIKTSIACDPRAFLGFERLHAHSVLNSELKGDKSLGKLVNDMNEKPKDLPNNSTPEDITKAKDLIFQRSCNLIKQGLTTESAKKIIAEETNTSLFKTALTGFISYVDIMAYLNCLNLYSFRYSKQHGVLNLLDYESHVSYPFGRSTFLLSAQGHVTRLVLNDDSIASLFEYIKAKEHEKRYRLDINSASYKAWM